MNLKNYQLILLFVLMCIFTLNSCGSDSTVQPVTTPTPTTFTVKGTVTNSQAQAVGGATCSLEIYGPGIAGSVIYTAQTDSSGKYSFSNI
ncbi:MAG: carboxypeptidase-like regulatory domain-containing protein, partial [Candidatus Eremiobacterota bacterium]